MGDVGIATVDGAGSDDPHRRRLLEHGADLHRRGVGPQHDIVGDVEGVLHVAGRMVARDVERLEVVEVVLDLRTFGHPETEAGKDGDDLLGHQGDRVFRARGGACVPAR